MNKVVIIAVNGEDYSGAEFIVMDCSTFTELDRVGNPVQYLGFAPWHVENTKVGVKKNRPIYDVSNIPDVITHSEFVRIYGELHDINESRSEDDRKSLGIVGIFKDTGTVRRKSWGKMYIAKELTEVYTDEEYDEAMAQFERMEKRLGRDCGAIRPERERKMLIKLVSTDEDIYDNGEQWFAQFENKEYAALLKQWYREGKSIYGLEYVESVTHILFPEYEIENIIMV